MLEFVTQTYSYYLKQKSKKLVHKCVDALLYKHVQIDAVTTNKQNKNELEADDQNSEIHYRGLFCLFQTGQAKFKLSQTALTINKRQNGRN